jgi:hypothetical protein
MAEVTLVDSDVRAGTEFVKLLDNAKFPFTGAAWLFYPDVSEWRLVVRTPKAEKDLQGALREVAAAMDKAGDLRQRLDLSRIKLVPPSDSMMNAIGMMIRADGVNTIRFSKNVINGIFIDDALIYRLAA